MTGRSRGLMGDLVSGAAAGYFASWVMDQATTWFYTKQSEYSKNGEKEANPDGTPVTVGRAAARFAGREVDAAQAVQWAQALHRCLGVSYGALGAVLTRRGLPPALAGLTASALGFALVDEGAMYAFLPPPTTYPVASHMRGVVGHLTHGATAGLALTAYWGLTRGWAGLAGRSGAGGASRLDNVPSGVRPRAGHTLRTHG